MKIVVFVGPPGSGKGTQASLLCDRLQGRLIVKKIATGDLVRAEIRAETPIGRQVKELTEGGKILDDTIIQTLLSGALQSASSSSVDFMILDGYPRNVTQAAWLSDLIAKNPNISFFGAVYFGLELEIATARIAGRRYCPSCSASFHVISAAPRLDGLCDNCGSLLIQREDDREDVVRERMKAYVASTSPLVNHYAGLANDQLFQLDAALPIETQSKLLSDYFLK